MATNYEQGAETVVPSRTILRCFQSRTIFTVSLLLLALALPRALQAEPSDGRELVFGRITSDPSGGHEEMRPILDYVVAQMEDIGITGGTIRMAKDNTEMARLLRRGEVDWFSETLISALYFHDSENAEIALQRWKDGTADYHAVVVVREDSNIETIEDLVDHTIAFEDSGSTSGYFLPAVAIVESGLSLEQLTSPRFDPMPGHVGFLFSNSEINSGTWVAKGIVDAAAFSFSDLQVETKVPANFRAQFKIIHETPAVPRSLELFRSDLDPIVKARLREILLASPSEPQAAQVLRSYEMTAGFNTLNEANIQAFKKFSQAIDEHNLHQ